MHPWKCYRVRPGRRVRLRDWDPAERADGMRTEPETDRTLATVLPELDRLQGLLYAEGRHRLLLVLQGMDTAGKDGTIRRVFSGVNPQGVTVAKFGPPTPEELAHDFLWRVHPHVPRAGEITIFNRSHYEDVLAPRVHGQISEEEVERRLWAIRAFERTLAEQGTTWVKVFLHVSRTEQARRLEARVHDPAKRWKLSLHDLEERPLWPKYVRAYEDLLEQTSTDDAPWFVVPSDHPHARDAVVALLLARALEKLKMRYPSLDPTVERALRRAGAGATDPTTSRPARAKREPVH